MNAFQLNFILILFTSWYNISVQTNGINQNTGNASNYWLNCLLLIAQKQFIESSSLAIINPNHFNKELEQDTIGWIVQQMMRKSKWSIMVKTSDANKSIQEQVKSLYIK